MRSSAIVAPEDSCSQITSPCFWRLEVNDCVFFGLHVSNPVRVAGILPRDKERLIDELEQGLHRFPDWQLNKVPPKGAEGRLAGA